MSGTEEDEKELELKDLIVQTLESNGLLSKIKAQLRASVFLALDENDRDSSKNNGFTNIKVKKLLATNEGREAVSLVRDFLEVCNLDFTISVFDPELNSNILMDKKDRLIKNLDINESEMNKENPILVEYLKHSKQNKPSTPSSEELPSTAIEALRVKFDKFDLNKRKSIEKDKLKSLFLNVFSNFNKSIIERFIADEIENIDKNNVNFDDFVKIYKKFYQMCVNVTNHHNLSATIEANEFKNNSDKFGFITSRNTTSSKPNNIDPFLKNNNKNGDSLDDPLSSSSSSSISSNSAFKRDNLGSRDKPKTDKSFNKQSNENDIKKKGSYLDDKIEDLNDVEILKASKVSSGPTTKSTNPFIENDDLFTTMKPKSSLGELPPLNNTSNFQNKFFTSSKEVDKKLNENDDYDDDFTNGTTPRTPKFERKSSKNRSAIGSDEEIEDNISYVDENSKIDEATNDRSISTIQGNNDADYIEDVSI